MLQDLITYDRKARQYLAIHPDTGEIIETFPPKHRHEAFLYLVSLFEPELYRLAGNIIERHPQLERVTWKAVEIVVNRGVELVTPPVDNVLAKVSSSDGYGRYAVTVESGYVSCQCEHWQSFAAPVTASGARYCKHIIAWKLANMLEDRF